MARIFITGGLGFIGSHISALAVSAGHQVVVYDDLSSGVLLNAPPGVTVIVADLLDSDVLEQAVCGVRPDLIVHLAAQVSVPVSFVETERDARVNVFGTLNLLEAARKTGVRRLAMASSGGAIYGEVPEGALGRTGGPVRPSTPYAVSKLAGEGYLAVYAQHHGLGAHVLRYGNVYGERQRAQGEAGVVAAFCQRLLEGTAVSVNGREHPGDRGCVRDYVYAGDVARITLLALTGNLPPVVDVGTGIGTDAWTLAETLMSCAGVSVPLLGGAPRRGDVRRSVLDGAPLLAALGSATSLRDGLTRTFSWYRQRQVETPVAVR